MRALVKDGGAGTELAREHARPPADAREANTRWRRFRRQRRLLLARLLAEQHRLCCYSEVRPDQLALGCHVEHVQPKSQYPSRTFDYGNVVACALDSDDLKTLKADAFGGHAKQSRYDAALFVSCLEPGCARFFAYLSDGAVVPALTLDAHEEARARYTIDLLNLNSPYLVALRRRWWDELDDLYAEHEAKGWSLDHLIALDLVPTADGLSPFFTLTRQFFKEAAERVLRAQAPLWR